MSPSCQALEQSLFKVFEISPATLSDLDSFADSLKPVFAKASAIKAMRQYLTGSVSCPRILGTLVYSGQGHIEIKEWLAQGMPIKLLYQCMLFDGGPWVHVGGNLPLADAIIRGGADWDFDYKLLNGLDRTTVIPGLVEAVLKRAIYQKHENTLVKALSLETLEGLIHDYPDTFAQLTSKACLAPGVTSKTASVTDIAQGMLQAFLDPVLSIQKTLLRRPY